MLIKHLGSRKLDQKVKLVSVENAEKQIAVETRNIDHVTLQNLLFIIEQTLYKQSRDAHWSRDKKIEGESPKEIPPKFAN